MLLRYSAAMRGRAHAYVLADNFTSARGRRDFLWQTSFLKTMANQHPLSVHKVATLLHRGS